MQVASRPLPLPLDIVVQSRIRGGRETMNSPRSLESLNRLLVEYRELYFLCKKNTELRNSVRGLANQTIEIVERQLLVEMGTLDLPTIQSMTRWGLSQAAKDQLLSAAVKRNVPLPIIQHLVECGADKYQRLWWGRNLLMRAAVRADQATVQYFIDQGLNPRARDIEGNTALRLAQLYRTPAQGPLFEYTFFPFENADQNFSTIILSTSLFLWIADMVTSFLPLDRMILQEIFSVSYAGLLAPLNAQNNRVRENGPTTVLLDVMEGLFSLSYMSHVVGADSLGIAFVYAILYYLAQKCLNPATLRKVIAYIPPIAKCVNVASMVAMVFTSCHPVYTAVNLTLYTFSLLDSRGYLPVPVQKIYYCALRGIQWVAAVPFTVVILSGVLVKEFVTGFCRAIRFSCRCITCLVGCICCCRCRF